MKLPSIKNPLSIFAIFSGLVETVCGLVATFGSSEYQLLLIIFIISYPVLLLLTFFFTLNYNHHVLYSPQDFKDSNINILESFYGRVTLKKITEIKSQSGESILSNENERKIVFCNFNDYLNNFQFSEDDKEHISFMSNILIYILKLIPNSKLDEIWADMININYFFIFIKINENYINEKRTPRKMYLIYLSRNTSYDNYPKGTIYGIIAGSGLEHGDTNTLGNHIVSNIVASLR